jgi:hypothetical protein
MTYQTKYDYIIPLGEECYTCQSIDNKFNTVSFRKCAFPFDYVGHSYIETVALKIKHLLEHQELESVTEDSFEILLFGDQYFYSDKIYHFHYWHEISYNQQELFTEKDLKEITDKCKRRYDRLIHAILSNQPILFISVNHYDNIYNNIDKKDSLITLYELLYQYNKNIKFIGINYTKDNFINNTLTHVVLETDLNIPFIDSKNKFISLLNQYVRDHINP